MWKVTSAPRAANFEFFLLFFSSPRPGSPLKRTHARQKQQIQSSQRSGFCFPKRKRSSSRRRNVGNTFSGSQQQYPRSPCSFIHRSESEKSVDNQGKERKGFRFSQKLYAFLSFSFSPAVRFTTGQCVGKFYCFSFLTPIKGARGSERAAN